VKERYPDVQLALVGSMAHDDPEGWDFYNQTVAYAGGDPDIYIGSADWMHRNLSRRVEVVCPIDDARMRAYLKDDVLQAYLRDNVNARALQADGTYQPVERGVDEAPFDSQTYFEGRDFNFSVIER